MPNAPFYINQGLSKLGRDLVEVMDRLGTEFSRADRLRAAMIEQSIIQGTLSTRTDNTSGQLTLDSLHGVLSDSVGGLYWNGGQRLGVAVGTVNGNLVPFSGGSGDNLPAQDTAITFKHFAKVAAVFKFNNGDGTTLDSGVALAAFDELAAFIANGGPSLVQCAARFKQ